MDFGLRLRYDNDPTLFYGAPDTALTRPGLFYGQETEVIVIDSTLTINGEKVSIVQTHILPFDGGRQFMSDPSHGDILKILQGLHSTFQTSLDANASEQAKRSDYYVWFLFLGRHMVRNGNMSIVYNAMNTLAVINGFQMKLMSETQPLDKLIFSHPDLDQLVKDTDYFFR